MNKQLLPIFTKKVETLYNEKLNAAFQDAKNDGRYNYTSDQIADLKLKIFNKYFKWPKIKLLRDGISVTHNTQEIHISQAQNLIENGFTYSISKNTVSILMVAYKIPFEGIAKALDYTVNMNPRHERIHINNLDFVEYYLFSQKDIAVEKERFKLQRDNLINLINENQQQVDDFFLSKKEFFLQQISTAVDDAIEKFLKYESDNDSLL